MSTDPASRTLTALLSVAWVVAAVHAAHASSVLTYSEYRLGIDPVIEWPRVVLVWAVLAMELVAFACLVRRLARTTSPVHRALWIAGGLAVALALILTVRMHRPEELNSPGQVALLLVLAGAAMGIARGMRTLLTRLRARMG